MTINRTRVAIASIALAAATMPLAVMAASPAAASGKPVRTCTVNSNASTTGILDGKRLSTPVLDAGTVVLKRDASIDGLVVVRATANTGWSKSVEVRSGPKVVVKFQQTHISRELEAFQSAAYYGPDILVLQVKTCTF